MKIINKPILLDFSKKHPKLESFLEAWIRKIRNESWLSPEDVLKTFPHARLQLFHRICFTIEPRRCYLTIAVNYSAQVVSIKWIGTYYQYPNPPSSLLMCA
ncbi:MAG: type II toxin-antitoxin system HigB family toxin [Alphaproteobacteria bacterium]|nr:type II toxin-antitoxin system HigB family toxin [Alphaproteobacteria bacterium]